MNTLLGVLLLVCIAAISMLCWYTRKLLMAKTRNIELQTDHLNLQHVTSLLPWINAQIERSTEVVLNQYVSRIDEKIVERKVPQETMNAIINSIRTHFYGTIPTGLSSFLFKYIDKRQIDILILTSFRRMNAGYFTLEVSNVAE